MSTGQGRARIEFEADASKVSDELIAKMSAAMDRIAAILEKGFAQSAARAEQSMGRVGRATEDARRKAEQAGASARGMGDDTATAASKGATATSGMSSAMDGVSKAAEKAGAAAVNAGKSTEFGAQSGASAATRLGKAMDRAAERATAAGSAATASMTGASRAAEGVASSASHAASQLGQVGASGSAGFDGASSAAQGLIGKLSGLAIGIGAVVGPLAMLKGGFDRLMNIQRAEIGFKNIGLTSDQTSAQMARLTEQVTGTSVSLADAAKYSAMFAQSGVEIGKPMDDTIKAYTSLSAAAQGTGTDVGVVMQQVSAAGKLMGGDAMQLQQAGINIYKYVADYMGKSVTEVKKLGEEGKISFADVVGSINAGMGDYAKEMGQTLPAKIGNLKTSVSSLGASLVEPFIGPLTKTVEFGTSFLKWVVGPIKDARRFFTEGGTAADILTVALSALGGAVAIGAIVGIVSQLGLIAKVAGAASRAVGLLNFSFLMSPIGLVTLAIGGLIAGFVLLWNRSEDFRKFWKGVWDGIVETVTEVVSTVKAAWEELTVAFSGGDWGYGALESLIGTDAAKWAVNVIGSVKSAWEELTTAFNGGDGGYGALANIIGEEAAEWAVNAVGSIKEAWEELKISFSGGDWGYGALSNIFGEQGAEWIINAVARLGDGARQLGEWFSKLWPSAKELGAQLGSAVWETAKSLFSALVDVGSALFDAFGAIGGSVWGLIQALEPILMPILKVLGVVLGVTLYIAIQAVIGALKFAAEVIKTVAEVISWLAENALAPLIRVLGDVAAALIDKVASALSTVVDWVGKVIGFVSDLAPKIGAAFTGAGRWLWDAGRDIVQGLLNGIMSLAGTIGTAFLSVVPGWIKEPFKKALGIASPSKLFAGYGRNIGEGLVAGIEGMSGRVAAATSGLAANAAEGAAGQIGGTTLSAVTPSPISAASTTSIPDLSVRPDLSVINTSFENAGTGIDTTKAALIDPAFTGITQGVTDLGATTQSTLDGVVIPAWNSAATTLYDVKTSMIDPVQAGVQSAMAQTGVATQNAMLGVVVPAVQQAGLGITAVQQTTVDPALAAMRGAVSATQSAFQVGASGINAEWNRIRAGTADPARFVIQTVFNDGIVGMWNSASELIGTPKMNPYPVGFKTGGVLPGYTPGRDVHRFVSATGGALDLSGGEAIMRPEWTRAVGGPAVVDQMNAAARNGRLPTEDPRIRSAAVAAGGVLAFAAGGVMPPMKGSESGLKTNAIRAGRAVSMKFPEVDVIGGYRPSDPYPDHPSGRALDIMVGSLSLGDAIKDYLFRNNAAFMMEYALWKQAQWNSESMSIPMEDRGSPTQNHMDHVHAYFVDSGYPNPATVFAGPPEGAGTAFFGGGSASSVVGHVASLVQEKWSPIRAQMDAFSAPGLAGGLPAAIGGKLAEATQNMINTKVREMTSFAGVIDGNLGAVERWRPMMKAALIKQGLAEWANSPEILDRFMRQIQTESGGDEKISQQIVDVNGTGDAAGVGLGQMIPGTFAAYRDPELVNDRRDAWAMTNAMARYVRGRYGPEGYLSIGNGIGYDRGGLAAGVGVMPKRIIEPERVLNATQTKAFEAWMNAGANLEEINAFVDSVKNITLDSPQGMTDQVASRFEAWMQDTPDNPGDIRNLVAALQSGVEWERTVQGMQRSAEAWANGDWVKITEDQRLATPEEMRDHVAWSAATELADELGGLVGLRGLVKAPQLVDTSGRVTLPNDTALTDVTRINPTSTTGPAARNVGTADPGGESAGKAVAVDMTINVNGVQDPMAVGNVVEARMKRGLETAIGGAGRSQ